MCKIWRHPQNRKYVTHQYAVRGGPSHGHRWHAQKICWRPDVQFRRYDRRQTYTHRLAHHNTPRSPIGVKKGKGSPYSITERRIPELIPVLGSQPACDVSHKPDDRLPLFFARPAVTLATLKRAATSFVAWWTEAQCVRTVCLRLLPDSVAAAIWTQAFCAWVQHANHSATEWSEVTACEHFSPDNSAVELQGDLVRGLVGEVFVSFRCQCNACVSGSFHLERDRGPAVEDQSNVDRTVTGNVEWPSYERRTTSAQ